VFAALAAAASGSRFAFAQRALRQNVEYQLIPPHPVATGERIEVIEFFWYGCPHCNNLQPLLEAWLKRKPADVELRRIPAIFRESWVPHARLYYTLEALGELGRLHQQVYHAIHVEYRTGTSALQAPWSRGPFSDALTSPETTLAWAVHHGIEGSRWKAAYESPEVERKTQESRGQTRAYQIGGTPSLVVDGRYVTSSGMAESMAEVIAILEGLIAMARERRASGAK
jgi:thiol:disulfide interchange protein DsbA